MTRMDEAGNYGRYNAFTGLPSFTNKGNKGLSGLYPGQDAVNLSDAIARQSQGQLSQATGVNIPLSPYEQLMQQLQQQIDTINKQSYATPYEQLRAQAESQVASQYDPQIQALRSDMERTRTRGEKNQSTVKDMYGDLSTDIASQLPEITAQMEQSQQEVSDRYAAAKTELQGQYDQQAAQQNAVLKQLGVQAAAPEANQEMMVDESYFTNMAAQEQQATIDALAQIQAGAEQYNTQSSSNARLAGDNAATAIATQLEDYTQQAQGQLSALESGRQSSIAALLAQLQSSDAQAAESRKQRELDNLMQMNNFQMSAMERMGGGDESAFKGTTGLAGSTRYLAEQYPNQPARASAVSSLVASVLDDPEVVSGRQAIDDPNFPGQKLTVDTTPELVIQKIREEGKRDGFSEPDINNAINAYLAYAGKLR